MRPDARQDHERTANGRIIYLGDVRRRQRARRSAPDRHYLAAILLVGAVAWAIWLTVFLTLAPARLLTYLAFFAPLGVAVASTGTLAVYAVDARAARFPSLARSVRRGLLISAVIVANLAFLAAHRWTPVAGIVSVALAVGIDLLVGRRSAWG